MLGARAMHQRHDAIASSKLVFIVTPLLPSPWREQSPVKPLMLLSSASFPQYRKKNTSFTTRGDTYNNEAGSIPSWNCCVMHQLTNCMAALGDAGHRSSMTSTDVQPLCVHFARGCCLRPRFSSVSNPSSAIIKRYRPNKIVMRWSLGN